MKLKKALIRLIIISLFGLITISILRYYQRDQNIALLGKKIWWDVWSQSPSPLYIDTSDTYHVGFIENHFKGSDWKELLLESPSFSMLDDDFMNRLKLFHFLNITSNEKQYIQFLVQNSDKKECLSTLIWYFDHYIYDDTDDDNLDSIITESHRYNSQRYLNIAYSLPPCSYYDSETTAVRLSHANKVVEFVRNNYPYIYKESKLPLSLKDNIAYQQLSEKEDQYKFEDIQLWEEFITRYPNSEKRDEATYNIINIYLSELEKHFSNDLLTKALTLCENFEREFHNSYLCDDALWHSLRLSLTLKDENKIFSNFSKLVVKHKDSDHSKRLYYRIRLWLTGYYKIPQGLATKITDLLFSLPINNNSSIGNVLIRQFPSKNERQDIMAILATIVSDGIGISNYNEDDFYNFNSEDIIVVILSEWIGMENG